MRLFRTLLVLALCAASLTAAEHRSSVDTRLAADATAAARSRSELIQAEADLFEETDFLEMGESNRATQMPEVRHAT